MPGREAIDNVPRGHMVHNEHSPRERGCFRCLLKPVRSPADK
jgi:hypothetical protein